MRIGRIGAVLCAGLAAVLFIPTGASAASTIVVTPDNTQGWTTADTRPGGAVNFVVDPTTPAGRGALQLTTDATVAAKAQYMHATFYPLLFVYSLSYWTKQNSASFPGGDPSYQLPMYLDGTTQSGFTTMVFEPYENPQAGDPVPSTVVPGLWQKWDVTKGQFWSSRTASGGGTCAVTAGGGGPPFYTLAALKAMCPKAVVIGYGVNIGSNNPSYDVETDLFNFNGRVYDFEPSGRGGGGGCWNDDESRCRGEE